MNSVNLIGRLTKDPEVRYTTDSMAVARFSIAIDRFSKEETDYPNIVCFGRTAENVERFLKKGRQVGITGRLQTGSYTNKDGIKVYTTEVVAERVKFLDKTEKTFEQQEITKAFEEADEDIPF